MPGEVRAASLGTPGGDRGAERLILQHIPTMDISYRDWDRPALDWEGREGCWWWLSRMLRVAETLRVGASADPVPNSPLQNVSAPNPLLNLSCSPLRVWSRSALPSDLNICKTWGGKKAGKRLPFWGKNSPGSKKPQNPL